MSDMKTQSLSPNRMTFREYVRSNTRFFRGEPLPREEKNRELDFACDNPTARVTGLLSSGAIALFTTPFKTLRTMFTGVFGKKTG